MSVLPPYGGNLYGGFSVCKGRHETRPHKSRAGLPPTRYALKMKML